MIIIVIVILNKYIRKLKRIKNLFEDIWSGNRFSKRYILLILFIFKVEEKYSEFITRDLFTIFIQTVYCLLVAAEAKNNIFIQSIFV